MLRNIEDVAGDLYEFLLPLSTRKFHIETGTNQLVIISGEKFDIACVYEGYEVIMVNP